MLNGAPIEVTTSEDTLDPNDGLISLREALIQANGDSLPDKIVFSIPGNGPHTIQPISPLPPLSSGQITIDATTQSGYVSPNSEDLGTRSIVLSGARLAAGEPLLRLASSQNVVRGLALNDSPGIGLHVSPGANGNQLIEIFVGTSAGGDIAVANQAQGILIESDGNLLEKNLVSGNATQGIQISAGGNNQLFGNIVGFGADGTTSLPNAFNGIVVNGPNNQIGGPQASDRNLITSQFDGIAVVGSVASGNRIQGNYIGTDRTGTLDRGLSQNGISVSGGASNNWIGSDGDGVEEAAEGNLISGSRRGVFLTQTSANEIRGNFLGTNAAGDGDIGNGTGVLMENGAVANVVADNLISGNDFYGVYIRNTNSRENVLVGNLIGTNASATAPLPNGMGQRSGVLIQDSAANRVGGEQPGSGNVISGNLGGGVWILGLNATGNQIRGNFIGTDGSGTTAVGNQSFGVGIFQASNNTVVENVVAGNGAEGVVISDAGAASNQIRGNHIGANQAGEGRLPNAGHGVRLSAGAQSTVVATNVISGNAGSGLVVEAGAADTIIDQNMIGTAVDGRSSLGNLGEGLVLGGSESSLRHSTISGNARNGVVILSSARETEIYGNRIGLTRDGDQALGNGFWGVWHAGGTDSRIGVPSADPDDRNIVSGNRQGGVAVWGTTSFSTLVQNNYIGTDVTGSIDLGNAYSGVLAGWMFSPADAASGMVIGGSGPNDGNLISGNDDHGIWLRGEAQATVQGNTVGLAANGVSTLGNSRSGVQIDATNNLIGGDTNGSGNTVSGNFGSGIRLSPSASDNQVLNNLIGTDVSGSVAAGNRGEGISVAGDRTEIAYNTVSGNALNGVALFDGGDDNVLYGNRIGLAADGANPLGNSQWGIEQSGGARNRIGFPSIDPRDRNVVSANVGGVHISGQSSTQTWIGNNYIGTDHSGVLSVGNLGDGVRISNGARGVLVGSSGDPAAVSEEGNLISGNASAGVRLTDPGTGDIVVAGNWIGVDSSGNSPLANQADGVLLQNGASNNRIGGDTPSERNIISGNLDDGVELQHPDTRNNIVTGNYIGTNAAGAQALPNAVNGVSITNGSNGNRIGGSRAAGEGNLISGNLAYGVSITSASPNNVISGNRVGTDESGAYAVANTGGIAITNASIGTQIGGPAPDGGNLVSGNHGSGIFIASPGTVQTWIAHNLVGTTADGSSSLGNGVYGVFFALQASDTLLERNLISGNASSGLRIGNSSFNRIQANVIGLNATGDASLPNAGDGISLAGISVGNVIGADGDGVDDPTEGNLVSGNIGSGIVVNSGRQTTIAGNRIGTDASGSLDVGNGLDGVRISGVDNLVGGSTVDARNLISGNGRYGILLNGVDDSVLLGNWIGVDATGAQALGNDGAGIWLNPDSDRNRIGGGGPGQGNLVSGNHSHGIVLNASSENIIAGNLIGTDLNGSKGVGNVGNGILVTGNSRDNIIGASDAQSPQISQGNTVSGNAGGGVTLSGAGSWDNRVIGNRIGVDLAGNQAIGNSRDGVAILGAPDNLIARNQIAGNGLTGITVGRAGAEGNWITGNRIGTSSDGAQSVPNAVHGIRIGDGGRQNVIGTNGDGVNDELEGNLISGNAVYGIELTGPDVEQNVVAGNLVGTDAAGTVALANGSMGITLERGANQNRIGTNLDGLSDELEGNTVSGNRGSGIRLLNQGTDGNRFNGNSVGIGEDGSPVPNQRSGFEIASGAANNVIGFAYGEVVETPGANLIANNLADGVQIIGAGAVNNAIRGNSISFNGQLGIDLGADEVTPNDDLDTDAGPNRLQNFLELDAAIPDDDDNLVVIGSFLSNPSSSFQVDFYASAQPDPSGFGEGLRYLESVDIATSADGSSIEEFVLASAVQSGEWITATVTDELGNTSEFSNATPLFQFEASGAGTIDEGAAYELTLTTDPAGQFPDAWQVEWGDGSTETLPGDRQVATHVYADGPWTVDIAVTAVYAGREIPADQTVIVDVVNVAPRIENVSVTELIQEGQFATLNGKIIDPGSADSFALEVDWGEAIETYALPAGTSDFSVSYFYDDDGLSPSSADTYPVTILSLLDDDGGSAGRDPIHRVSIASDDGQGDGRSWQPSTSADGRFVAFASSASNLVAGDTNNAVDVFVHDRRTGATERVSVDSDGAQGDFLSSQPSISADGRFVAFASFAGNLVAGDTNNISDIFVHDRRTGATERVSIDSDGAQGDGRSLKPSISADGRFVAFYSEAGNLVAEDTNNFGDIFVHDRLTGATERISIASDGGQGDRPSIESSISADGRFVAFYSEAGNLAAEDTNNTGDTFVHDRLTGATERISIDSDGAQGDSFSWQPSISADGRFVAFASFAGNLVAEDTNNFGDIFVHDRLTGATERISIASDGGQGDGRSLKPSISADGRFVAFYSEAGNLVAEDTNNAGDIFVHDRLTGATERISDAPSFEPSISADGRFVAFYSEAGNLVAGDTNNTSDVFVTTTTSLPRKVVTVANVAPAVSINNEASQGLTATVYFSASDVSRADTEAGFEFMVDWGDGSSQVIDATPNNSGEISLSHVYTSTDTYQIQVSATDKDSGRGLAISTVDVALDPQTIADDLEAAITAAIERDAEIELDINSTADLLAFLSALGEVPSPESPVAVVLNFNGGIFDGLRLRIPSLFSLVLFNGTFRGASPAITVESGNVILDSLHLINDTDSPTLLIEDGSVAVRNSRIEESGNFDQTAVAITGGTADLGNSDSPGGNRFETIGEGQWIANTSDSEVSAIGNAFQRDATPVVSGFAIEDGIQHRLDGTDGLVRYEAATLYVTPDVGDVQLAIDAAAPGDAVQVQGTQYPGFSLGTSFVAVEFEDGLLISQELDSLATDQRVVRVQGTDQSDWVGIRSHFDRPTVIDVAGYPNVDVQVPDRVVAYGDSGNDWIGTVGNIDFPVWLYGGDGDDILRGGRASDFLSGGAGDDILFGGLGRDLLIGGTGADQLLGQFGDDILIAGWTVFDLDSPFNPSWTRSDHELAIGSILAEWKSTHSDQERRANLSGTGNGDRKNGDFFLIGQRSSSGLTGTVFEDDQRDQLFGMLGQDWFFLDDDRDQAVGE